MKKKKIIVIFSHSSGLAGAEFSLIDLTLSLQEMGHKCIVILPSKGPLENWLKKFQIKYEIIPYGWWMINLKNNIIKILLNVFKNILLIIYSLPIIIKLLLKYKAEIIISNTSTIISGALASNIIRRPHIWFIREYGAQDQNLNFYFGNKLSLRLIDILSSKVVFNSINLKIFYQKYIKNSKSYVLFPMAVKKVPKLHNYNRKSNYISCLFVGRLSPSKGPEDAILATRELIREGILVRLYIAGKGSRRYENYLRELVANENIEDFITFCGWIDNPFEYLKETDVFLMCSRKEAFGRVTLEAMLNQKPIIGANSGGTSELVYDRYNGFLYTPGNYKELANKIKIFYQNRALIKEYGRNGYFYAIKKYNYINYKKRLFEILKSYE